jgi:hypothetical protein
VARRDADRGEGEAPAEVQPAVDLGVQLRREELHDGFDDVVAPDGLGGPVPLPLPLVAAAARGCHGCFEGRD